MASKNYWEDGGTATGKDDYGFKELAKVLKTRLKKARDIRYSLRYMKIQTRCRDTECRAYVDVLIDASYTVDDTNDRPVRMDKRDQNQFVLERDGNGDTWKFLSGM